MLRRLTSGGRIPKNGKTDWHARWTLKFTKVKPQDDGSVPATDLAIPFFGYKSHVSIDRKFKLIRKWKTTDAAATDDARLREGRFDRSNTAPDVWADTAYRSKAKGALMEKQGFVSKVHRKKPHLKRIPQHIQRCNEGKSMIRSRVEHVFADQKSQMGLFIRSIGITLATMRIGPSNIVYNMRCLLFLERTSAACIALEGYRGAHSTCESRVETPGRTIYHRLTNQKSDCQDINKPFFSPPLFSE